MIALAARAVQTAVDTLDEKSAAVEENNWLARDGEYAIAATTEGSTNRYAVVHLPTDKVVATRTVDPAEFIISPEDDIIKLEFLTADRVPERRKILEFER